MIFILFYLWFKGPFTSLLNNKNIDYKHDCAFASHILFWSSFIWNSNNILKHNEWHYIQKKSTRFYQCAAILKP
jgi:hypothetical protein